MKLNIIKSADCKICDTNTADGVVLTKESRRTGALSVGIKNLKNFDESEGYGEKVEFVCNDCLQALTGASLIQFVKDDFSVRMEPEDSDILDAMDYLITGNHYITTLDVKNRLRGLGFWATQDKVHAVMIKHVLDDENTIESIGIQYMNHQYYYDTARDFMVQIRIGDSGYALQCHATPLHVYYKLIETIRMVWEVSKEEVHDTFSEFFYDELEEVINNGKSQKSWDEFKTLNYELKELVGENIDD